MSSRVAARFSALFVALAFVRIQGAEFYVSTQGSDSNSGTASQPFRTITRAYKLAGPGVTITVMPGTYTDYRSGWGLHLGANGTASSPIVLRSQVKGGAIIDGQNLSDRNKGIYLDGSYNIVDGFQIKGGPNGGITIWGNYNQIINNEIHHNGNPASTSTNGKDGCYSDQSTHHNVYKANYVHDNGRSGSNLDHGFYLCGDNELALNNVLAGNAASGLQIAGYTTVSNMKVYNNVVAHNGTSGIILWMALGGVDIKNNIIYQNARHGISSWDAHGSGVVMDRNLFYGNGYGAYIFNQAGSDFSYTLGTTITSAPQFVNSSSSGFDPHLSSSSPAINAGLNLSSTFTTDMTGVAWPSSGAWDLGVYCYASALLPTLTVAATDADASEAGSNPGVFTFTRTGATTSGLAVLFRLSGSATKGNDYLLLENDASTAIAIPAGASSATLIINPVHDTEVEGTESVIVTVVSDATYAIGSPDSATITIEDALRVRRQASQGTDTDSDGITDADELIAGTDLNNSQSVFKVSSVAKATGSGSGLIWPSVAGKTYRVLCTGSLDEVYWTDVSGEIVAEDTTTSWTDTSIGSNAMRFYSVMVGPTPSRSAP